jgi:hypothetical protein
MAQDSHPNENQIAFLSVLISQAEAGDKRYSGEITLFAEGLRQKCGHNKLEALGIPWKQSLSYTQCEALSSNPAVAGEFARFLHSRLITHLSPDDAEIHTLGIEHFRKCGTALRMGVQGLIRWRASLADRASVFMPDTTLVTEGLCPVIRDAANDFFSAQAVGMSAVKSAGHAETLCVS